MLGESQKKQFEQFQLDYDKNIIDEVSPDPKHISLIRKNEVKNFYFFLKDNITTPSYLSFNLKVLE